MGIIDWSIDLQALVPRPFGYLETECRYRKSLASATLFRYEKGNCFVAVSLEVSFLRVEAGTIDEGWCFQLEELAEALDIGSFGTSGKSVYSSEEAQRHLDDVAQRARTLLCSLPDTAASVFSSLAEDQAKRYAARLDEQARRGRLAAERRLARMRFDDPTKDTDDDAQSN